MEVTSNIEAKLKNLQHSVVFNTDQTKVVYLKLCLLAVCFSIGTLSIKGEKKQKNKTIFVYL